MSTRSEPSDSPVRAARLRLGLSQRQVADALRKPVETYKHWDRGENRPGDPAVLQLLSMVLETPLEVLYPPQDNPTVARALRERDTWTVPVDDAEAEAPDDLQGGARDDRAIDAGLGQHENTADLPTLDLPTSSDPPAPRPRGHRRRRRGALAVAASISVLLAVTAAATDNGKDPVAVDDGREVAAVAELSRRQQDVRTEMQAAAARGDFDRAIVLAARTDDVSAAARYREAASMVLVRRAEKAAARGDLPLARSRLQRARVRYKGAPGAEAVNVRIRRIERDRSRRAAERRAQARRRAAAARRRAADELQRARRQAAAPPAPATTAAPASSAPAPSGRSTPTPSSGSTRKPPREREQAVDPGLF